MNFEIVDNHVHSCHSPDACDTVAALCARACELSLKGIAITDHCECDLPLNSPWNASPEPSYQDITTCKEQFDGKLMLLYGIELGQPVSAPRVADQILDAHQRDFVLASVHQVEGVPQFHKTDYTKVDPTPFFQAYFTELEKTSRYERFDSLAHIGYPLRYYVQRMHKAFDVTPFDDIVDQILKNLIHNGKALELNTENICNGKIDLMPERYYFKRYCELGGELVTVGSDAHETDRLADHFEQAYAMLAEAGLKYTAYYVDHKPHFIKITD